MPVVNVYVSEEIYVKLVEMDYPNAQRAAANILKLYFAEKASKE